MSQFRKPAGLKWDYVIPTRRRTASGVMSGFIDTKDARWCGVILERGQGGNAAARFKMTFGESDTLSAGPVSSMTAISGYGLSGFGNLTSGTLSSLVAMVDFACSNGNRKRFIGVKLSLTGASAPVFGVHSLLMGNTVAPLAAGGATSPAQSASGFFSVQSN